MRNKIYFALIIAFQLTLTMGCDVVSKDKYDIILSEPTVSDSEVTIPYRIWNDIYADIDVKFTVKIRTKINNTKNENTYTAKVETSVGGKIDEEGSVIIHIPTNETYINGSAYVSERSAEKSIGLNF